MSGGAAAGGGDGDDPLVAALRELNASSSSSALLSSVASSASASSPAPAAAAEAKPHPQPRWTAISVRSSTAGTSASTSAGSSSSSSSGSSAPAPAATPASPASTTAAAGAAASAAASTNTGSWHEQAVSTSAGQVALLMAAVFFMGAATQSILMHWTAEPAPPRPDPALAPLSPMQKQRESMLRSRFIRRSGASATNPFADDGGGWSSDEPAVCQLWPCRNGGVCRADAAPGDDQWCDCPADTVGAQCERVSLAAPVCAVGYTADPTTPGRCVDTDECADSAFVHKHCGAHGVCVNTPGSYHCAACPDLSATRSPANARAPVKNDCDVSCDGGAVAALPPGTTFVTALYQRPTQSAADFENDLKKLYALLRVPVPLVLFAAGPTVEWATEMRANVSGAPSFHAFAYARANMTQLLHTADDDAEEANPTAAAAPAPSDGAAATGDPATASATAEKKPSSAVSAALNAEAFHPELWRVRWLRAAAALHAIRTSAVLWIDPDVAAACATVSGASQNAVARQLMALSRWLPAVADRVVGVQHALAPSATASAGAAGDSKAPAQPAPQSQSQPPFPVAAVQTLARSSTPLRAVADTRVFGGSRQAVSALHAMHDALHTRLHAVKLQLAREQATHTFDTPQSEAAAILSVALHARPDVLLFRDAQPSEEHAHCPAPLMPCAAAADDTAKPIAGPASPPRYLRHGDGRA